MCIYIYIHWYTDLDMVSDGISRVIYALIGLLLG